MEINYCNMSLQWSDYIPRCLIPNQHWLEWHHLRQFIVFFSAFSQSWYIPRPVNIWPILTGMDGSWWFNEFWVVQISDACESHWIWNSLHSFPFRIFPIMCYFHTTSCFLCSLHSTRTPEGAIFSNTFKFIYSLLHYCCHAHTSYLKGRNRLISFC